MAPAPTGFAHIGTVYMALFNWAFSEKHDGTFILRIDDTDLRRQVKGVEQAIFEAFEWLGLDPQESPIHGGNHGPYRQSERLKLYSQAAEDLLSRSLV
jgi:glutamyl-tRNA synthetase